MGKQEASVECMFFKAGIWGVSVKALLVVHLNDCVACTRWRIIHIVNLPRLPSPIFRDGAHG